MLEEIAICGLVFTNRDTMETTIAHVLINWASSSAKFYSSRSNKPVKEEEPVIFPLQLFQDPCTTFDSNGGLQYNNSSSVEVVGSPGRKVSLEGKTLTAGSGAQFGALWSDPPPFRVSWGSIACPPSTCPSHSGISTYVYRLSPTGDLSAVVVNQKKASETRVIFFSPLSQVGISVKVYPQPEEAWSGRWVGTGVPFFCLKKNSSALKKNLTCRIRIFFHTK